MKSLHRPESGKERKTTGTRATRKNFLHSAALALWGLVLSGGPLKRAFSAEKSLEPRNKKNIACACDLAVVRGDDVRALLRKALDELGGIGLFVKKNDIVVIKPNIGWNRGPEFAANTNPELVSELVRMCVKAGAKKVRLFDNTCNNDKMCYRNSGIYEAARRAGGDIYYVSDWKFIPGRFPQGSPMRNWPIFRDAVECDCFINVPVAKHHSLTGLTLSMKNLMGVCGGQRGRMHWDIDVKLADLTAFINPDLTIIDAYRVLLRHGPSGGNVKDVEAKKTIIAGTDPVLADSYAATLFNIKPSEIGYIVRGAEKKLGSMDIAAASVRSVAIDK